MVRVMGAFLDHLNGQLVLAIVVAAFSMVTYVLTRRRELAWKRTEFLFAQAQYFDNDPVLVEATMILEGRHQTLDVGQIFDPGSKLEQTQVKQYRQKFDKLLNFLWRLGFAYLETKALSLKEVEGFGWYLWRISEYPLLFDYCENSGFEEIATVIRELRPIWEERGKVASTGTPVGGS